MFCSLLLIIVLTNLSRIVAKSMQLSAPAEVWRALGPEVRAAREANETMTHTSLTLCIGKEQGHFLGSWFIPRGVQVAKVGLNMGLYAGFDQVSWPEIEPTQCHFAVDLWDANANKSHSRWHPALSEDTMAVQTIRCRTLMDSNASTSVLSGFWIPHLTSEGGRLSSSLVDLCLVKVLPQL